MTCVYKCQFSSFLFACFMFMWEERTQLPKTKCLNPQTCSYTRSTTQNSDPFDLKGSSYMQIITFKVQQKCTKNLQN